MKKKNIVWIVCSLLILLLLAGELIFAAGHMKRAAYEEASLTDGLKIRTEEKKNGADQDDEKEALEQENEQESEDDPKKQEEKEKKEKKDTPSSVQVQLTSDNKKDKDGSQTKKGDADSGGSGSGTGSSGKGTNGKGNSGSGGNDSGTGTNDSGDSDSDDGEDTPEKNNGDNTSGNQPYDDSQVMIVTDLSSREITFDTLTDDQLPFYAYLENASDDMYLKVKLTNKDTSQNGSWLSPIASGGKDYTAKLSRNTINTFTIYAIRNKKTVSEVTYYISYVAKKASGNSTVGDNPPTISTNLDGFTDEVTNRNFTFTVTGKDYKGKNLTADQLEVYLDKTKVTNPTGGPQYEYQLYFPDPTVGDTEEHTVTVLGWDNEGNSRSKTYTITYRFVDTGDEIGTAYIVLDATTVGIGVMEEPYEYRIHQDEPASYAVLAMLEHWGYEADYSRSPDDGFYLKRISRGGMADGADIPAEMENLLELDGVAKTGQHYDDSLGEFDFTQGSGWMYSVGGEVYAGKSLSSYYLSNGDTLYLRFTLAWGKDIGGSGDGTQGSLQKYCCKWINGECIENHEWEDSAVIREATCTEDGLEASKCAICHTTTDDQVIPALGHDYREVSRTEPTETEDGSLTEVCSRCGDTRETVLEKTGDGAPSEEETGGDAGVEDTGEDSGDGGSQVSPGDDGGGDVEEDSGDGSSEIEGV